MIFCEIWTEEEKKCWIRIGKDNANLLKAFYLMKFMVWIWLFPFDLFAESFSGTKSRKPNKLIFNRMFLLHYYQQLDDLCLHYNHKGSKIGKKKDKTNNQNAKQFFFRIENRINKSQQYLALSRVYKCHALKLQNAILKIGIQK